MALQFEIMPVTPFRQNCTLLWDDESGQAVLTDVGGDVAHVLQEAAKRQLQLQAVWLTHGHLDHAGGVADLLKQQAVPVWGPHADDGYLLESLPANHRILCFLRLSHCRSFCARRLAFRRRQAESGRL